MTVKSTQLQLFAIEIKAVGTELGITEAYFYLVGTFFSVTFGFLRSILQSNNSN